MSPPEEPVEPGAAPKPLWLRLLYTARDWRSRAMFDALARHTRGEVLDVGGWDFFLTARRRGFEFERWTTLEPDPARTLAVDDGRVHLVHGDGCAMDFADASFDTVLCIQVLEHVLEPLRMVEEIGRVLRPGGTAVFLIPQTSTTWPRPTTATSAAGGSTPPWTVPGSSSSSTSAWAASGRAWPRTRSSSSCRPPGSTA